MTYELSFIFAGEFFTQGILRRQL